MKMASDMEDELIDRSGDRPVFFPMGRSRLGRQDAYVLGPEVQTDRLLAVARTIRRHALIYMLLMPVLLLGTMALLTAAFPGLWAVAVGGGLLAASAPIFVIRRWYYLKIKEHLKAARFCPRSLGPSDLVLPSWSTWFQAAIAVLAMMAVLALLVFAMGI